MKKNKTILFYAHVKSINLFEDVSFYEQDIRALRQMGYTVITSNRAMDFFFKRYDYVYIWWWSRAILPIIASWFKRTKVCIAGAFHYSTPLMDGTDFVRRGWLYKILVSFCLRSSAGNIFVSRHEFDQVTSNLLVNNPQLVHHGIDIDKYKPLSNEGGGGLLNTKNNILAISWLEEKNIVRKCLKESVMAFDMLVREGVDANLYIAGREGPGFLRFKEFIDSLPSAGRITLLGHVSEKYKIELLQSVDVFVSPTLYEGFGVAIAEALACGCPVVTSDNGAVKEVAGDCAIYVDPHSPEEISAAIKKILFDFNYKQDRKLQSPVRIGTLFSYERHLLNLSKAIKQIF